jgi:hypothetical protein
MEIWMEWPAHIWILESSESFMKVIYIYTHTFSPENERRKAAKRKGSWAHQQTDKITPWTIVSLSVVEDVGESDSKLWKDRRVNVIQGSIAGRLENVPGSVETSSCLLNQKHHSTLFILRLLRGSMRAAVWSLKIYIILYYIYVVWKSAFYLSCLKP